MLGGQPPRGGGGGAREYFLSTKLHKLTSGILLDSGIFFGTGGNTHKREPPLGGGVQGDHPAGRGERGLPTVQKKMPDPDPGIKLIFRLWCHSSFETGGESQPHTVPAPAAEGSKRGQREGRCGAKSGPHEFQRGWERRRELGGKSGSRRKMGHNVQKN